MTAAEIFIYKFPNHSKSSMACMVISLIEGDIIILDANIVPKFMFSKKKLDDNSVTGIQLPKKIGSPADLKDLHKRFFDSDT